MYSNLQYYGDREILVVAVRRTKENVEEDFILKILIAHSSYSCQVFVA